MQFQPPKFPRDIISQNSEDFYVVSACWGRALTWKTWKSQGIAKWLGKSQGKHTEQWNGSFDYIFAMAI